MTSRVALVGTGLMGLEHLRCLRTLPHVELVAVSDRSPTLAEAAAARFGVPRWFGDHARMLAETRPDVVHVATPATTHVEIALDALAAGAHVFVEKPIAVTYVEWEKLRDLARQLDRRLVENHTYLFDPRLLRVDALVASGAFGRVSHVDVRFFQRVNSIDHPYADPNLRNQALPGGPLTDLLPHLTGIVTHFVGRHRSVEARWHRPEPGSSRPADEVVALVEAEGGTATMAVNANTEPEGLWIGVYGSRMQARMNLYEGRLTLDRSLTGSTPLVPVRNGLAEGLGVARAALSSLWGKLMGGPGGYAGFWELARRFHDSLEGGTPAPMSLDDIDASALLMRQCLEGQP